MKSSNKFYYYTLFISLAIMVLFFILPKLKIKKSSYYIGSGLYTQLIQKESCTNCHKHNEGFIPAHNPEKIGCTSCHLGKPNETKKENAHQGLVIIPGNLSNASQTCAKCHQGVDFRIKHSPMNTMSGVVSIDKYVFGENTNLDSLYQIHHIANNTPAEKHLRNKCASCHLANEKTTTSPITEKTRGGGCLACHLNYNDTAKNSHINYKSNKTLPKAHASISLAVTDNHCFGCHSRSGRISTNYEGWHETQLNAATVTDFSKYRVLEDNRVFTKKDDDVHHKAGMSCIDCHDTWDVMGTGKSYAHQEDAVSTTCISCHNKTYKTKSFEALSPADKRMIKYRKHDTTAHYLFSDDKVYYNVQIDNNKAVLITKNTNKKIAVPTDFSSCLRDNAHQAIACSSCHTSWAPQCISCHTSFDSEIGAYDLLAKKEIAGSWIEKGAHYKSDYPTLAVVRKNGKRTIKTVAPGMIMTLDLSGIDSTKKTTFHRLFAPVSAHTITKKTPDCKSCHLNPLVLGYGRGKLYLDKKRHWQFVPEFKNHQDGLPLDAWIAFMSNDTIAKATRKNVRPFNQKEQKQLLLVGSCLNCHTKNSVVVSKMLINFDKTLKSRSKKCVLPKWN